MSDEPGFGTTEASCTFASSEPKDGRPSDYAGYRQENEVLARTAVSAQPRSDAHAAMLLVGRLLRLTLESPAPR